MKRIVAAGICLLGIVNIAIADPKILPMRERAAVIDQWLETRMETVLPDLMRRTGIDMWVIISREYNEDPVIKTMLPSTWVGFFPRTSSPTPSMVSESVAWMELACSMSRTTSQSGRRPRTRPRPPTFSAVSSSQCSQQRLWTGEDTGRG